MFTFRILIVAVVTGIVLSPGAASAATFRPSGATYFLSHTPSGGDPDTTVTFTVTTGALSMTAPDSADLGSGGPGDTVTGQIGNITVTDDRALLSAAWTVTAAETDWTTGTSTAAETIPAADATYDSGTPTTTGTITATGTGGPIALSNGAQTVVTGTAGVGDNTATWDPTVAVAIPAAAVGGPYTGTLTHSVS
jgi:hypothetical protein